MTTAAPTSIPRLAWRIEILAKRQLVGHLYNLIGGVGHAFLVDC
jgi:hypothetical protein